MIKAVSELCFVFVRCFVFFSYSAVGTDADDDVGVAPSGGARLLARRRGSQAW